MQSNVYPAMLIGQALTYPATAVCLQRKEEGEQRKEGRATKIIKKQRN